MVLAMSIEKKQFRLGSLALVAILALLGALGCDLHDDIAITFENRTTMDLSADIGGGGFEKIEAGQTVTVVHYFGRDSDPDIVDITVRTDDGDVVFNRGYSREELRDLDNTVVLEQSLLPE